ncbi:MAG: glycosyltransferase family 4 protein [Acidimicrobiales bacterium]
MTRIVFDTTQLVHWPGSLTGIPRVMDELARRFQKADDTVEFVSWVTDAHAVARIDLDRFHGEGGVHYIDPTEDAPRWARTVERLWGRIARIESVPPVGPYLGRISRRLSPSRLGSVTPFELHADDVLVIGWGEWWDPNFIRFVVDAAGQGVKVVQMVHDLGPVSQPHLAGNSSSFIDYFTEVLPVAALLVSVSDHTRQELLRWGAKLGLNDLPITVIREGDTFTPTETLRPSSDHLADGFGDPATFALCVGTIEAKKNHALLYYVYKQAARRKIALPPMVIVGRRGWRTDDIYGLLTEDPEIADRFVFLHDASDAELAWLYENCRYTVFPSFFEGWGIPIAESVSRGVPCLCSSAASMPEIAPGAVRHFHPDAPLELLSLMEELNDDEALDRARQEVATYIPTSWDQTYAELNCALAEI